MCIFNLANGQTAILCLSSAGGVQGRHQHERLCQRWLLCEMEIRLGRNHRIKKSFDCEPAGDECRISRRRRRLYVEALVEPHMTGMHTENAIIAVFLCSSDRRKESFSPRAGAFAERNLFVIACSLPPYTDYAEHKINY